MYLEAKRIVPLYKSIADKKRDAFLKEQGIDVIRITGKDFNDIIAKIESIPSLKMIYARN